MLVVIQRKESDIIFQHGQLAAADTAGVVMCCQELHKVDGHLILLFRKLFRLTYQRLKRFAGGLCDVESDLFIPAQQLIDGHMIQFGKRFQVLLRGIGFSAFPIWDGRGGMRKGASPHGGSQGRPP